jgi:peptide/nickel transport system substrate-binding protein
MTRWWRHINRTLGWAVVAVLVVSGCQPDRSNRSLLSEDGLRTVRVLYSGANEHIFGPTWDDTPKFLIFQPLVTYEANTCSDIVGGLAARWEPSADWKTWTVELRPDVRWHDGVPVTSADIVFTVNLWKHPDVLFYGAAPVDSIVVLDSLRFRAFLKRPSDWPLDGWDVFYPAHLLEDLDPSEFHEWEFWTQPVGNGPFRYVRHIPETMVELEANPDYYLGRPSLDRVRIQFKTGGQSQSGVVELLAGNVDVVSGLSPVEAGMLEEEPGLHAYYVYQALSTWLIWNFFDPRFSDVGVRQALAHATDREELHRALGFPDGVPVTDGVFFMCDPQNIRAPQPHAYDLERARTLLADAGWRDSDADGVLDRDGVPFSFTLLLDRRATSAAVFVQEQLRRIGVDMQLLALDWSVVNERFEAGDFEAIIVQRVTPERIIVAMDSPLGQLDDELARAVNAAETEPDLDRRLQLWETAGNRYRDFAPAMFLHPWLSVLVADERIEGFGEPGTIVPRMSWRHAFGGLEHLWIADEEPVRP